MPRGSCLEPSIWEEETGRWGVQDQLWLHNNSKASLSCMRSYFNIYPKVQRQFSNSFLQALHMIPSWVTVEEHTINFTDAMKSFSKVACQFPNVRTLISNILDIIMHFKHLWCLKMVAHCFLVLCLFDFCGEAIFRYFPAMLWHQRVGIELFVISQFHYCIIFFHYLTWILISLSVCACLYELVCDCMNWCVCMCMWTGVCLCLCGWCMCQCMHMYLVCEHVCYGCVSMDLWGWVCVCLWEHVTVCVYGY